MGRTEMRVTVKYFASLREALGRAEEQLEVSDSSSVAEIWTRATAGTELPAVQVLCAVNKEYADNDQPVCDGDEVAFFPPVTGG